MLKNYENEKVGNSYKEFLEGFQTMRIPREMFKNNQTSEFLIELEKSSLYNKIWKKYEEENEEEIIKKYTINLSSTELEETVECDLIGGNSVNISRSMIITHLVMHGGYHRGIIAEMLGQTSLPPIAQDITVWEKTKLT